MTPGEKHIIATAIAKLDHSKPYDRCPRSFSEELDRLKNNCQLCREFMGLGNYGCPCRELGRVETGKRATFLTDVYFNSKKRKSPMFKIMCLEEGCECDSDSGVYVLLSKKKDEKAKLEFVCAHCGSTQPVDFAKLTS